MQPYGRRQRSRDSVSQIDSMISRIWRDSVERLAGRGRGRLRLLPLLTCRMSMSCLRSSPSLKMMPMGSLDSVVLSALLNCSHRGFFLDAITLHCSIWTQAHAVYFCEFKSRFISDSVCVYLCVPPRGLRLWVQDRTGPWNPAAGRTTAGPPVSDEAGTPLRTAATLNYNATSDLP